ncbi:hypothetical protein Cfor_07809 [Coptotermes formosanus]|uniref:Transposase Helix-turn-helix domain-containing protein n=1 Tax=Coptotermes formosanus TaxID=36987 RepID=A0A6L2PJU3_COPFO|nr:hypothetical protein Cfor_07809 [Coptotermes formosanus]
MWCEGELLAAAAAAYIILSKKKKQRRRRRIIDGRIQDFVRISSTDLECLQIRVEPLIQKADTTYRAAVSTSERLPFTLRFLARGDSFTSLMCLFRISKQAISKIVPEVRGAVVSVLQDQVQGLPTVLPYPFVGRDRSAPAHKPYHATRHCAYIYVRNVSWVRV